MASLQLHFSMLYTVKVLASKQKPFAMYCKWFSFGGLIIKISYGKVPFNSVNYATLQNIAKIA